jgi:hypothetical protein
MVSPSGGIALNPKILNLKPNSNLPIFPPKLWKLHSSFHVRTHLIFSFKKKTKIQF